MEYVRKLLIHLSSIICITHFTDYACADLIKNKNNTNSRDLYSENRFIAVANSQLIELPDFDNKTKSSLNDDLKLDEPIDLNSDMKFDAFNQIQDIADIPQDDNFSINVPDDNKRNDQVNNDIPNDIPNFIQDVDFNDLTPEVDQLNIDETPNKNSDLPLPSLSIDKTNVESVKSETKDDKIKVTKSKDNTVEKAPSGRVNNLKNKETEEAIANSKMIDSQDNQKSLKSDKIQKFITSEEQLLSNPLDDVIFGRSNEESKNELEDFRLYIDKVYYERQKEKILSKEDKANKFLSNYSSKNNKHSLLFAKKIFYNAITAIRQNGNINQLSLLVDNYPIINMKDKEGNNLLHHAIIHNNLEACKLLLKKGINMEELNNNKKSPLVLSTQKNNKEIIQLLKNAQISKK